MQTHPKNYPTNLTDEEWEQIKSLVPSTQIRARQKGASGLGSPRADECDPLCGARRCAWRLLPGDFPPWQTVYGYFRRWSQDWTWTFIHDALRDWLRKSEGRAVAPTAAIIDSQSVKTPDPSRGKRLRRGQKDQRPQAPRGGGRLGLDFDDGDHQRRRARSGRRQDA